MFCLYIYTPHLILCNNLFYILYTWNNSEYIYLAPMTAPHRWLNNRPCMSPQGMLAPSAQQQRATMMIMMYRPRQQPRYVSSAPSTVPITEQKPSMTESGVAPTVRMLTLSVTPMMSGARRYPVSFPRIAVAPTSIIPIIQHAVFQHDEIQCRHSWQSSRPVWCHLAVDERSRTAVLLRNAVLSRIAPTVTIMVK